MGLSLLDIEIGKTYRIPYFAGRSMLLGRLVLTLDRIIDLFTRGASKARARLVIYSLFKIYHSPALASEIPRKFI
jgi:hypothetical protein